MGGFTPCWIVWLYKQEIRTAFMGRNTFHTRWAFIDCLTPFPLCLIFLVSSSLWGALWTVEWGNIKLFKSVNLGFVIILVLQKHLILWTKQWFNEKTLKWACKSRAFSLPWGDCASCFIVEPQGHVQQTHNSNQDLRAHVITTCIIIDKPPGIYNHLKILFSCLYF